MIIGYARVSTKDQDLSLQLDAFSREGVEKVFKEKASGKNTDRPQFQEMLKQLRSGDKVVIYKLDRLGRSLKDLLKIMDEFNKIGVDLKIIEGLQLDTSTAGGRLMFNIVGAFAEYERELISERTLDGLASARARGMVGGRKPEKKEVIDLAFQMYDSGNFSIKQITQATNISKMTLYRYLKKRESNNLELDA